MLYGCTIESKGVIKGRPYFLEIKKRWQKMRFSAIVKQRIKGQSLSCAANLEFLVWTQRPGSRQAAFA